MIKTMLRPVLTCKQFFFKNSIPQPSFYLMYKNNSDLSAKKEIVSQSQTSNLISNNHNDQNLSLIINQDFIKMLDQRLNSKNFRSLAYKQDELNSLIYKLENPFHLFYLYEKYSPEFNSFNLVNLIKKLAYFSRNQKLSEAGLFFIPEQINKSLTKQLIKAGPHLESFQCLIILEKLVNLGYKINDFSIKTMLQLLKFHVNEFNLDDIIRCKEFLTRLIENSDGTNTLNEYAENLDSALNLAVQIKFEDLKNVKQSVRLLKNFKSSISDTNFERIICFIYERLMQKDVDHCVLLAEIMAERNFSHLKLLLKIKKIVLRKNVSESDKLQDLHDSFLKLKFYDLEIQDYFIKKQIENAKNSEFNVQSFNRLLESSNFFVHKNLSLLDFIYESKLFYENQFSVFHFILYSALTGFEKINEHLPELVERFLDQNHTDESKIALIKSLSWLDQTPLAEKTLSSIQTPQNLNIMDKLFIRDVFNKNSFKIDEMLPVKTKLEEMFEETIEKCENYDIKWLCENLESASYFKNFEIFDRVSNKKCFVQFSGVNEKFRNIGEQTCSYKFKKIFLINTIKCGNEADNCLYWILEIRKFRNLGNKFDEKVINTLNEIIQNSIKLN